MPIYSDSSIAMTNAPLDKLFGYSRGELVGQPVERLIPERLHSTPRAEREVFQANPTERRMGEDRELFGRHKDGREIPVGPTPRPRTCN